MKDGCPARPALIDAALTFGILWLDDCRVAQAGKMVVEGLKLFLPAGTFALTRERIAHLHQDAAKWQLYELENRDDQLKEIEFSDGGNIRTRLVHWTDDARPLSDSRGQSSGFGN